MSQFSLIKFILNNFLQQNSNIIMQLSLIKRQPLMFLLNSDIYSDQLIIKVSYCFSFTNKLVKGKLKKVHQLFMINI